MVHALSRKVIGRSITLTLSEHERHELGRLEKQLSSDDPQFAQSFSASEEQEPSQDPLFFGLAMIAVGAFILLVGVVATAVILALTGIIVTVLGVVRMVLCWLNPHNESFREEQNH